MSTVDIACNNPKCAKIFTVCYKKRHKKYCGIDCFYSRNGNEKKLPQHGPACPKNVELICEREKCKKAFTVPWKLRKRRFCSLPCSNGVKSHSGRVYRTKETHPEWAKKVSDTHKARGTLVGDKNPMKNEISRNKTSVGRKKFFAENPDEREKISLGLKKAWSDGRFEGVQVGRCKWYSHTKPSGETVRLQGKWEVVFAQYLDKSGIPYEAHPKKKLKYTGSDGGSHTYFPDFYLPDQDAFVDVKGAMFYDLGLEKMRAVQACNPETPIVILTREGFSSLGINIDTAAQATPLTL
jgi:hypothetical protein